MMSADFIRARRRYKMLLREQQTLTLKGRNDVDVDSALEDLVREFPQLAVDAAATAASNSSEAARTAETSAPQSPSVVNEIAGSPSPVTSKGGAPEERKLPVEPTMHIDVEIPRRAWKGRPSQLVHKEVEEEGKEATINSRPSECFAMSMWVLQVFNEAHQRSLFGPVNCMKVVVISCAIALFHRFCMGPCTAIGSHILPSLFCLTAHVHNLYSIFLRRKAHLSFARVLVYLCLDVAPSLMLCFVAYAVTLLCCGLVTGMQVTFVC